MALDELFSLKGKVIVITGAAGLLGLMHAEAVAQSGGIPILLDLKKTRVNKIAENLVKKFQCQTACFSVDITDESQIEKNVAEIVALFGKIDGLVNNASNNPQVFAEKKEKFTRLENFSLKDWQDDVHVGLTERFCVQSIMHAISQNPAGGAIINISSDLGSLRLIRGYTPKAACHQTIQLNQLLILWSKRV